ncbi:hypothetical protein F2Q69_00035121 [Brassica cretica]|uniref:Uncharacterized protein n=1 Tax=Brassica cretica TaxID=69181 RepID=A0A8S9SQN1_BRACR|nr:hypothetical protein F2Q69_00035121 [Brassica cretica]
MGGPITARELHRRKALFTASRTSLSTVESPWKLNQSNDDKLTLYVEDGFDHPTRPEE